MEEKTMVCEKNSCVNYAILNVIRQCEWVERDHKIAGQTYISPKFTTRKEVADWIRKTKEEIKNCNKNNKIKFSIAIYPATTVKEEEKNYKSILQIFLS